MASEIVADADAQLAATLASAMVVEARVGLVAPQFFVHESISDVPTMALKTGKHPTTADAGGITDGTAMGNTGINPTSVSITAAGVGLGGDITLQSERGSLLSRAQAYANYGRALVNKMDVDGCSNMANFSTTVGVSGADLTIAQLLTAVYDQEVANEVANLVYLLHPIQVFDARSAIVASAAPVWTIQGDGPMVGFLSSVMGAGTDPNFKGYVFGVPVYSSSNVPSANAGADRAGALFSAGRALKWVTKWMPETSEILYPKLPGWSLAVHTCYGSGEILDGAGTSIITDL
jgi:hypothetical protein